MSQQTAPADPVTPVASQDWLTPDFYSYEWHPLERAELTGDGVIEVAWPDGTSLDCHVAWLRENAHGDGGINPDSRENELDPAELPNGLTVSECHLADGGLVVAFDPEGREARYHPGWLRHVADGLHRPDAYLPEPVPWTTADFTEPLTFEAPDVLADPELKTDLLVAIAQFGLVRLRNCPIEPNFVGGFATSIAPAIDTPIGMVFDVEVQVTPDSLANTGLRLPPHTDFPGWETPPGVQFLACIRNTVKDGHSTMTDGLALANYLSAHHPEEFESLTTDPWVFHNRSPNFDVRVEAPVISRGEQDTDWLYRGFHPVRGFPAMAPDRVAKAYAAVKLFSEVAASDQLMMRYPFAPGDIVIFDNRRVLHGREAFSLKVGTERLLRGAYANRDMFNSRVRVLLRHREAARLGCAA